MAREAVRWSEQVILTSDNPRFEEPDDIIRDMAAGLSDSEKERALRITDRAQAIKNATLLAKKGDVILVAGKGHEDYQEIKGVKYPFDDREQIRKIFASEADAITTGQK
jgi:UDP-N-acetylmuramoyl-L-alanyl-D-glutamate--2,6-diaminopimelate ligase